MNFPVQVTVPAEHLTMVSRLGLPKVCRAIMDSVKMVSAEEQKKVKAQEEETQAHHKEEVAHLTTHPREGHPMT